VVPHKKPFVEMSESLLDCIIKEPPQKMCLIFSLNPVALYSIYIQVFWRG